MHLMKDQYIKILLSYHKDLAPIVIKTDKDIIQCYNLKYPNHFSTNCVIYFIISKERSYPFGKKYKGKTSGLYYEICGEGEGTCFLMKTNSSLLPPAFIKNHINII